MKKFMMIYAVVLLLSVTAMAQNKVAVLNPNTSGGVELNVLNSIREIIISIVHNADGYEILERAQLNEITKAIKLQGSDFFDEEKAITEGKAHGAKYLLVSNVEKLGNEYQFSCKLVNLESTKIEKSKVEETTPGVSLTALTRRLVGEMFEKSSTNYQKIVGNDTEKNNTDNKKIMENEAQINNKPQANIKPQDIVLVNDGMKILNGRKVLKDTEVKTLMARMDDALEVYKKGIRQNKTGNGLLYTFAGIAAIGLFTGIGMDAEGMEGMGTALIGAPMIVGSFLAFAAPGIALKVKAKKNIEDAVDLYNHGGYHSSREIKFGITGNGVGMALKF